MKVLRVCTQCTYSTASSILWVVFVFCFFTFSSAFYENKICWIYKLQKKIVDIASHFFGGLFDLHVQIWCNRVFSVSNIKLIISDVASNNLHISRACLWIGLFRASKLVSMFIILGRLVIKKTKMDRLVCNQVNHRINFLNLVNYSAFWAYSRRLRWTVQIR